MPCYDNYPEPNADEKRSRETMVCLRYLLKALNREVPDWVDYGADNPYGSRSQSNAATAALCELITKLPEYLADKVLWNGRDANARRLADWWEDHQKYDQIRRDCEEEAAEQLAARQSGLAKLTPEEKVALGIRL